MRKLGVCVLRIVNGSVLVLRLGSTIINDLGVLQSSCSGGVYYESFSTRVRTYD